MFSLILWDIRLFHFKFKYLMLEAKEELISYTKFPIWKRKLEENRHYLSCNQSLLYIFILVWNHLSLTEIKVRKCNFYFLSEILNCFWYFRSSKKTIISPSSLKQDMRQGKQLRRRSFLTKAPKLVSPV